MIEITAALAEQFDTAPAHIEQVIRLVDEGNTIPFIARYRKELTGSMDDQVLRAVCDRLTYLRNLEQRRLEIAAHIEEQGAMTDELRSALDKAAVLSELEDIYRPFRPKRKTRASMARAKGLEPLALALLAQEKDGPPPETLAADYVNEELGVSDVAEALAGARDIIAELAADDAGVRGRLRALFLAQGQVVSKAAGKDDSVYAGYYDYTEPVSKIADHRVLAIDRGEREGFLKVSVQLDAERATNLLYTAFSKAGSPCTGEVREALEDAYTRLVFPSAEREIRKTMTERAAESAIRVFGQNLRPLLMQPPISGKVVMALDPGFRNGCKAAVVDPTGLVLDTGVIYPVPPHNRLEEAARRLTEWVRRHGVQVVAIGNGTASRETEQFVVGLLPEWSGAGYVMVNEAGASIYSASPLAAEEFPDMDVSLRSAVSLARRLQDPLAELVKSDPKTIGVGQYQHDVDHRRLDETLRGVVEDCVNSVGADLNTASPALLEKVAGITPALARSVVAYREENGPFQSRTALKKVPKLGPKAFEQCAGFLRVRQGKELLDNTGVHPESYAAARKLVGLFGLDLRAAAGTAALEHHIAAMGETACAEQINVGLPTLKDIVRELMKPGRDPRDDLPAPVLRTDVLALSDLKADMMLDGTVRNVVDFGAFVDIGVHQDGLVHISQICDRFIKHPGEVLTVGDVVRVKVLAVDMAKKRISLSMKAQ